MTLFFGGGEVGGHVVGFKIWKLQNFDTKEIGEPKVMVSLYWGSEFRV